MSYEYSAYSNLSHGNVTPDSERYDMASDESNKMLSPESICSIVSIIEKDRFPKLQLEIQRLNTENQKFRKMNSDQALEIYDLKEENKQLQAQITKSDVPRFHYAINRRLWQTPEGKLVSIESLERLADQLFELASHKDKEGNYLILYKKDIVPIYLVLSQSNKLPFNYKGKLPDFELFWNDNIADRMEDPKRRADLTIDAESFKDAKNDPLWKNEEISSWQRLACEGFNSNEYQKAVTIKQKIESFHYQLSI